MAVIRIDANLQWRAERGLHSDRWIAFCDPLGISTEADTLDELHSLIPEAHHLLMMDLLADNELEAFLKERGWSSSIQGTIEDHPEPEFRVPYVMSVASGADGSARKAH